MGKNPCEIETQFQKMNILTDFKFLTKFALEWELQNFKNFIMIHTIL